MFGEKGFDVELMIEALTFFFGHMIDNLLLPGQVENWIFITDLKGLGITSIPFDPIKKLLGFLQHNYRGRLYRMYIVNAPGSVYLPWQMVKKFLQEATVKKIQFSKQQCPEPLFEHANRDQVEQKYGGTAPNLSLFWPFKVPSDNYFMKKEEEKCLVTKQEYISLYNKGQLGGHKINKQFIEGDKIQQKIEPVSGLISNIANNLSLAKDATAASSCDNSAIKVKHPSDAYSSPERVSKVEVLTKTVEQSSLSPKKDECQYTEGMEENNDFSIRVYRVREFKAYFLSKLVEQ